ncbi:Ig-like domain-containing protein, partial [Flavobacterium paronense]
TGNYYVSQTVNSCQSLRTAVAVTINTTAAPTASAQAFCTSATVANLIAAGTSLQWYSAATGGTALASTTALVTGNYYVSQTVNSCQSLRTAVAVTINTTASPTALAQTFNNSATVANLVA